MAMLRDDDFSQKTKETLAKRVGYHCSNPDCNCNTVLPDMNDELKVCKVGQAAHITAASPGGPRYDESMTHEERRSINNGIWLCNVCARLIDVNESAYPVSLLHRWKEKAEERQLNGDYIYINEVRRKQLESIYSPIHRKIRGFCNTYFYDEGYLGIDEDTLVEIIQIIQDNQHIADSDLLDWQEEFDTWLFESRNHIRPHNPEYDPLYDTDKRFLTFVESKIGKIKKDTYVD